MRPLTSGDLLEIICRTLDRVDARLMGHGERVAVIMHRLLLRLPQVDARQRAQLCLLGLLHDIGAYKTEEIDELLRFEQENVWAHSIYGYLFLRTLSPLGEEARPVLHHHLSWQDYDKVVPPLDERDFAGLIHLADRMDICNQSAGVAECLYWAQQWRGCRLTPFWADLLLETEAAEPFLERLARPDSDGLLQQMRGELEIDPADFHDHLCMVAYAIDFRSEFMVLHTVTTGCISYVLAELLELDPQTAHMVGLGALLHDIGKISTPVEILEKPGRLTPEEMTVMRDHVVHSRAILTGTIDQAVVEIAARHHERMDGTGYPQGLPGSEQTLAQQIVAVADVVSALSRQRSYKDPYDKQKVHDILIQQVQAGGFSEQVVLPLLTHYDKIMAQADLYGARITGAYDQMRQEYVQMMGEMPRSETRV